MTHADCMALVNDVEREFPVDTWTVAGIHIWPFVRVRLYHELFYAGRQESNPMMFRGRWGEKFARIAALVRSYARYLSAFIRDAGHNDTTGSRRDFVFLTYTGHRVALAGSWFDRYCDPFVLELQRLGQSALILEMTASESHYMVPRSTRSVFIQPVLEWTRLKNYVFRKHVAPEERHTPRFEELEPFLEARGLAGCRIVRTHEVDFLVGTMQDLRKYFLAILERVKPRAVFIAEYYNIVAQSLIRASRDLGIPSVDIQHGVQGELHAAYGRWTRIPEGGYDLLPSHFWVWSDSEAKTLGRWDPRGKGPHQAFVGGNAWLDMWKSDTTDIVRSYRTKVESLRKARGGKPIVLLTLTLLDDLSDRVREAVVRTKGERQWWIRLHPGMLPLRHKVEAVLRSWGVGDEVEWEAATSLPLPALLQQASVNVTTFSTTIMDAAYFGLPSIYLDRTAEEMFPEQIASGLAVPAFSTDELVSLILNPPVRSGGLSASKGPGGPNVVDALSRFAESIAPVKPPIELSAAG